MPSDQPEPASSQAKRGRLKIYFGATAGVGLTYAMLRGGQDLKVKGVDVVVGTVETHGWAETQQLLAGLEMVAPRTFEHRGGRIAAFDLDATLARRPKAVLLDEIAQANPTGCRHAKRWQDARELLDAGIDVHATLTLPHLESLAHVVERIVGAEGDERIPDHVFEQADEIHLVDLPPEDLLRRMRSAPARGEGGLGLPQLMALRELALRLTAERVRARAEITRQELGGPLAGERLMVCIGVGSLSAKLVRATRRMAATMQAEWIAVYVESPRERRLGESQRLTAVQTLRLAELLGAEVVTLSGDDVASELLSFARQRGVGRIVVGKAPGPRWRELFARPLAERLVRRSGDIDVYVINGDQGDDLPTRRQRPQHSTRALLDWGVSSAVLIAVAAATSWLYPVITRVDRINVGLIYLVAVVLVAARSRRELTVFFAILAMLGAHALIRDLMPQGFQVQDTLAFGAILVVGLTVSALAVRVHHQLDSAYQREARTAALHAVSRDLATIRGIDAILAAVVRHSQAMFGCPVGVLLPDPLGRPKLRAGDPTRCAAGSADAIAAQWAFANGRPAGLGTDTLRRCEALHVPLMASQGTVGVLSLFFITPRRVYSPERRNQVEAFAHQTALAIECDNLALRSQAAQLEVDAERLRNALLSSVSHDLRTPLAAITGAASTLVEHDALLDQQSRHDLALTISEVADNMSRLVGNLLDMTRIEAGKLRLRSEPHPLADVVGSTMTMMERRLQGRTVEVVVPAVLPLVPLDGQLIQEVLVNLIDNAIKYAPAGSPLRVEAEVLPAPDGPGEVRLSVCDRGPGVTADERERIFEKFYRGAAQGHQAGVGLGLAICRAIVVAHGGRIWAEIREGGGASFRFTLPLPIEPAATPAEAMPALASIPEPIPSPVASVAAPPADGTVTAT